MSALTVIEAARRLAQLHYAVVPCCASRGGGECSARGHGRCGEGNQPRVGKRPLVTGYLDRLLAPPSPEGIVAELRAFAQRGITPVNIAIVTGIVVVIEADSAAAEDEVLRLAGADLDDAPTRERRPGRGRGWFFAAPDGAPVRSSTHLGASRAIDVRAHGAIFIVPPSRHWTGHLYSWVVAPWDVQPPPIPEALMPLLSRVGVVEPRMGPSTGLVPAVSSRVRGLIEARQAIALLWDGLRERGDTSRSGIDCALARELLRARVPEGEILAALAARPDAHRRDDAYVRQTLAAARKQLTSGTRVGRGNRGGAR